MAADYFSLSPQDGDITFLVGENGSGKSTELRRIALRYADEGAAVVAISGSVFDKFPSRYKGNYCRLSPSTGRQYVAKAFKTALSSEGISEEPRSARLLARTLKYAGFLPALGFKVEVEDIWRLDIAMQALENLNSIGPADRSLLKMALEDITPGWRSNNDFVDLSNPYHTGQSLTLSALVRFESLLRRNKILKAVNLRLVKENEFFDLAAASSGELTLLSIYAFLAPRMTERIVILIDEPENSLHPRWQSEYCKRLFDLFYLYKPKLFIASHSPIIVSGAEANKIPAKIIVLPHREVARNTTLSIDGLLMEAFGVLAPASHYLSERVAGLLNDLMIRKSTLDDVQQELERLKEISYEEMQRDFLSRAVDLAVSVYKESQEQRDLHAS